MIKWGAAGRLSPSVDAVQAPSPNNRHGGSKSGTWSRPLVLNTSPDVLSGLWTIPHALRELATEGLDASSLAHTGKAIRMRLRLLFAKTVPAQQLESQMF